VHFAAPVPELTPPFVREEPADLVAEVALPPLGTSTTGEEEAGLGV